MKSWNGANLLIVVILILATAIPAMAVEGSGPDVDRAPKEQASASSSMERAPDGARPTAETSEPAASPFAGPSAFALDLAPGANLVHLPDITIPGTWSVVGHIPEFYPAGDFLGGDYTKIYALNYYTDQFVTIDTTTAVTTVIGTSFQSKWWSGMTGTLGGTLYACAASCGTASTLYRVNPANGALTLVGDISNGPCIIDIAINAAGQMYGVDIVDDVLVRIDPATAAGTVIGYIGFDANFSQGMDFDDTTGVLYLAAYNRIDASTIQGELRTVNTGTGATTLVGLFPGGAEVDALAIRASSLPPAAPVLYSIDNADGDGTYLVDWSSVSGATGYVLQEDDNISFSSPNARYNGSNTQFQVTGQAGGTWYYRVQASGTGGSSSWSGTQSATVKPAAPVLYAINNADGNGAYLVDWGTSTGTTSYTLQEDDNASFSSPTSRYSGPNSQFQVSGQALGTWYYRARANNAAGSSPWSGTQTVNVSVESQPSWIYLPFITRKMFSDPYEPNDTFETAWGPLTSGSTYNAFFPTESDNNDYYYVTLPAVHNIEVWLTNLPAGHDYDLTLYDEAHVVVQHSGNIGTVDEHILATAQPPGKYYIRIRRVVGTSQTQPYALRAVFK